MERDFDLSEGRTAYVESDDDARAVYVVTKHPNSSTMRTDAPFELDGLFLTTSERFEWARAEAERQRAEMRKTHDDE